MSEPEGNWLYRQAVKQQQKQQAAEASGRMLTQRVWFKPNRRIWHDLAAINLQGTEYPIAGCVAGVEEYGNVSHRQTMSRNLFLLGRSKRVDDRQAVMSFVGPDFEAVVPIEPKQITEARAFCASVNTAAKRAAP